MLKVYDEETKEILEEPDLEAGCTYKGTIVVGYTEEQVQVMDGTITQDRQNGLRRLVPAKEIVEPCEYYHKYTAEELVQESETNYASKDYVDAKFKEAVTQAIMLK